MVNEYFKIHSYGGTLEYYLFELANFSTLAFLALILYKLNYINSNSLIAWVAIFFTPLLINYFVLSPWMFGDQFEYAAEVMSLKARGSSIDTIVASSGGQVNPITFSVKILGLAPLPNYMTVTSLAFANKFLLFAIFLWFKRFFNNENEVLVYFLVPSLILYSSMSLRDSLIIVIALLFIVNLIRGRYFFSALLLYPLFILKLQMFVFLSLYFIARLFFRAHKNYRLFASFVSLMLIGGFILEDQILIALNLYRIAFAAENFVAFDGSTSYNAWAAYGGAEIASLELSSLAEAIFKAIINLPIFLLIPLPWNWTNIFYPMQALESCLLIYLYVRLGMKENLFKNNEFILLTFILIVGLSIYALLMSNVGTFVRYRFSIYYPFLLAAFYLSNQLHKDSKKEQF